MRMTPVRRATSLWLLLGAVAFAPSTALAQTSSASPDGQDVTVTGQRMPGAEAPRSATCEALAQDPSFAARLAAGGGDPLMGPLPYLPTRRTRNPDYSKPPTVPPGSPLPELSDSRFGLQSLVLHDSNAMSSSEGLAVFAPEALADPSNLEAAVQTCRALFRRGVGAPTVSAAGSASEDAFATSDRLNQRFQAARSFIVGKDRTLPMAFALFDQGRYRESLEWFRKAASKLGYGEGGDEAELFVGKITLQGLGDKSNPAEAIEWLKKAATAPFNPVTETPSFDPKEPERNTAIGEAAVILGNLYRNGFGGVAKNPAEARKWYARANAVGHVPAAKVLGDLYLEGTGAQRDPKKAQSLYRQAAKLDYAPAQVALADLLMNGDEGVKQDREEALAWYQTAAKKNDPRALYALARAYDLGEGVTADPQLALGFYKTAALHGSAAARVSMGTYFYEGKLVPKDDAAARRWFEAAAKDADPDGMFNLAAMLAKGEGGEKDVAAAWTWMRRAAALGHATAPRAVAALEARMTPEEKQRATAPRGG